MQGQSKAAGFREFIGENREEEFEVDTQNG